MKKKVMMIGVASMVVSFGCGFMPAKADAATGTMRSSQEGSVIKVLSHDVYAAYDEKDVFFYNDEEPSVSSLIADMASSAAKDAMAAVDFREGHWDVSDSMDGLSIAFTNIYEVEADGSRGDVVVVAEKHGPEQDSLDVNLVAGKTYEAELEIFNDSETDVLRVVDVNLCGSSGDDGFFFIKAEMASDSCYWARSYDDQYVKAEENFVFYAPTDLTITPENVYTLIEKDSEGQFIWREIGVRLSTPDDAKAYRLRTAVFLRETSKQKITFRFAVA